MKQHKQFEGWYFKQQYKDLTLCFIVGKSDETAFIQVISQKFSHVIQYDKNTYYYSKKQQQVRVGNSVFGLQGLIVNIEDAGLSIQGRLTYHDLTPIKGDVMGPFRYLPAMECRHRVHSLDHSVKGQLNICGVPWDFTGGRGYIEGDEGSSFPLGYLWIQCNDFDTKTSIMLAVAHIPYLGVHFTGVIGCVYFHGKEYRLATYKGARIEQVSREQVIISQGKLRMEASFSGGESYPLAAPMSGNMDRSVEESVGVSVHFKMFEKGRPLFNLKSKSGCLEISGLDKIIR